MALVSKAFGDIITFTRASTGSYFDSAGVLQSAAINAPRLDYNPSTLAAQGLLIEEQRTNSIRNNTMQGAVAGTPGTVPTNWASVATTNGLNRQIVGTGTANGITYIDIRYSGTTTAGTFVNFAGPEGNTFVAATNGQAWTSSAWVAVVGGSTANLTGLSVRTRFSDAGGVELTQAVADLLGATSTMQRFSVAFTAANASTAFVATNFSFSFNNGVAIDITLRIGLPQLELGAFATSVIPTTTAAVTRSVDVASVNTLSPWYNATEGTLYAEYVYSTTGVANQCAFSLDDLTSANTIVAASRVDSVDIPISSAGGVAQLTSNLGVYSFTAGQTIKRSIGYKLNDFGTSVNGGAAATDNTYNVPIISRLTIGAAGYFSSSRINGHLRRITYYPRKLSSAELQTITT